MHILLLILLILLNFIIIQSINPLNQWKSNKITKQSLTKSSIIKSNDEYTYQNELCKTLFHKSPEIRKVIKIYLLNNFFGVYRCNYTIKRDDTSKISSMLQRILPPSCSVIEREDCVHEILDKFGGKKELNELEFVGILLCNSLWQQCSESLVKELVYIDTISSIDQSNELLSEHSRELLKSSLLDDGSMVPFLSHNEIKVIHTIIMSLNNEVILTEDDFDNLMAIVKNTEHESLKHLGKCLLTNRISIHAPIDATESYLNGSDTCCDIFESITSGLKWKHIVYNPLAN